MIMVLVLALVMLIVAEPLLPKWFASPA